MTQADRFLDRVYDPQTGQTTQDFYDDWSQSYDADVGEDGYLAPARAAKALAGVQKDRSTPMLDLGCGTGLSGAAFREAGFTTIDGADFSAGMLGQAREKGIYRHLTQADLVEPLPFEAGTYGVIAAVGVLNPGHGSAHVMNRILAKLTSGGLFVFSLSEHALADHRYVGQLNNLIDSCYAWLLHRRCGPHLRERNLKSYVYVLQKP